MFAYCELFVKGDVYDIPVWLTISAVSTLLKLLRLGVYWTEQFRYGLQPQGQL